MVKTKRTTGDLPARLPKGCATPDHLRLARKLAACNQTRFAGSFMRECTSMPNPANIAERYRSVDEFRHDYMLYNLLRKFNAVDVGDAFLRAQKAYEKFIVVDDGLIDVQTSLTWNELALHEPEAHTILWRASRKISSLLGSVDLDVVLESCSFSHGATALHKRDEGRAPFKYSFEYPEVTYECSKLAWTLIQRSPLWRSTVKGLTLVRGNRLTTVPKDNDIDRVIACEPTMNMYIQKGIGAYMRRRLCKVGIDLNDQTINQRLARDGSVGNNLATIDLSAASDSISLALCKLLLPEAWYDFLLTTRSDCGTFPDGSSRYYNKISSMGNGYTFELESLLFWAITQACEDRYSDVENVDKYRCSVYGDDIICRSVAAESVISTLAICGFSTNDDKSFLQGPFRESCGKHYFHGVDVSPFFIRRPMDSLEDIIGTMNRLRRWTRLTLCEDDPRYTAVYDWLLQFLPSFWRKPKIPDGYGDGALFGNLSEVKPTFVHGIYKTYCLVQTERGVKDTDEDFVTLGDVFYGQGAYLYASHMQTLKTERTRALGRSNDTGLKRPGDTVIRTQRIKLYEWSDCDEYRRPA